MRVCIVLVLRHKIQNPSRISKADKLATSATLLLLSNRAYLDIVIRFDMLLSAAPFA